MFFFFIGFNSRICSHSFGINMPRYILQIIPIMYCFIGCVAYLFLKVMKILVQKKLRPMEFNKILIFILEIELNLGNTRIIDAFLRCNHPPHVNFNLVILDHISNWSSSKLDHVIKHVSLSLLHVENIPHLTPPVYWLNFVFVN